MPGPIIPTTELLPAVTPTKTGISLEFSYRQTLGLLVVVVAALCAVLWPIWFHVHDLVLWEPAVEDHFKATDGQVVGLYSRVRVCEARLHIDPSRP